MRVGIAADSHSDWATLDRWAVDERLDAVVHCGDCGTTDRDGAPVWAARGNHDQIARYGRRPLFVPDYRAIELGGLLWLFLGCCSGAGEVAPPPGALPPADVLVSHEAPFNPRLGWDGHPVVRQVVARVGPRWCFSGHWHHPARGAIGRTACRALGAEPSGWLVAQLSDGELRLLEEGTG